jgi:hypothetical protein
LQSAGGRLGLVSLAREHLIKHHAPITALFDTDTLNQAAIADMVREMRDQVASAAVGVQYDFVSCIPQIEVVFFEGTIDLRRLFPHFKEVFVKRFARTNPRQQLEVLFKEGGGPTTLGAFLERLTSDEVEKVQAKDPIRRLVVFITNNRAPVRPPP